MASAAGTAAGGPTRRVLLRAAGASASAVALAGLAGCGLRLENATPPTPPARVPGPDEAALLRVLTGVSFLSSLASRVRPASATSTRLAALHRQQAAVVRDRLRTAGVPDEVTEAAVSAATLQTPATPSGPVSTSGPAPTTATPQPPTATRTTLTSAESTALGADLLVVLPGLTAAARPLVAAIAASVAAGTTELGRAVTWPSSDALGGSAAAHLLDVSRAAAYGLEVAAARVAGADRAAVVTTLTAVRRRVRDLGLTAGAEADPEPLGYPLPFPVTDPASVRRLVTHTLSGLVARGLDPLTTGAVADGSTATTAVVRLQAEAVGLARAWGVAPTAFPGMVAA